MFDLVQNNKAVQLAFKVLLVGVTVGLVVSYGTMNFNMFNGADPQDLAKVGDKTISERDLGGYMHRYNMKDSDKGIALETLVRNEVLDQQAAKVGITVNDTLLTAWIQTMPAFQKNGKFDYPTMLQVLRDHQLTPESWEPDARRNTGEETLLSPVENTIVPTALKQKLVAVVGAQRMVTSAKVEAKDFVATAPVSDTELNAYYQSHKREFKIGDQVKLQYLVLSPEVLAQSQTVSDAEAKAFFDQHQDVLAVEERKSRHILILAGKTPDQDKVARAKAEQIALQLQKNPEQFAAIAKSQSQDSSTAPAGGDLNIAYTQNGNGQDPAYQPYIEALFKLKLNQVSPVVKTQFGYHVIQLAGVQKRTFEEAKSDIFDLVKREKANKLMTEDSSKLADLTLSNIKTLDPAAKARGLTVQTSDWVAKGAMSNDPVLGNKKLLETVFAADAIKSQQNSDVIDLDNNAQAVVRVVDFKPAHVQALSEVAAMLKARLQSQSAARLADEQGKKLLADLQHGAQPALKWEAVRAMSRGEASSSMTPDAVKAVFNTPLQGNNSIYVGAHSYDGYVLYRVAASAAGIAPDADQRITAQLRSGESSAEGQAYLKTLEAQAQTKIYASKDNPQ